MKIKGILLLAFMFILSISCDSRKTGEPEDDGNVTPDKVATELFECAKNAYQTALDEKRDIPVNEVIECRQNVEKKYAEQLKDPEFKKEFDAKVESYKKELEEIINKFEVETIQANEPVKIELDEKENAAKGKENNTEEK